MSQTTRTNGIDRLLFGCLYRCSHWIGKSMSGFRPCCRHRGSLDCPAWFRASSKSGRSEQASTHGQVKWSHASVGLAQARHNYKQKGPKHWSLRYAWESRYKGREVANSTPMHWLLFGIHRWSILAHRYTLVSSHLNFSMRERFGTLYQKPFGGQTRQHTQVH